jgi:phosphoribosylaminoimidazole-succinocarboxamide synthase
MNIQTTSSLPLPLFKEGKVRAVYEVGENLLIVTTDRVSSFDVILNEGIPGKGKILTRIATHWFEQLKDIVPNQLIASDSRDFPSELHPFHDILDGRSMLVHKTKAIPVECVVRGYIAGSAWSEYQEKGSIAGIVMPEGLQQSDRLETPIFTPAIKNDKGHDENISFAQLCDLIGEKLATELRDISLKIYVFAHNSMYKKGLILADTKFEFGHKDGQLMLIDEALTPDSSRYWEATQYKPGISPPSYDKQIIRDYLQTLPWDKTPPAPPLSPEIIAKASRCYETLLHRIVS